MAGGRMWTPEEDESLAENWGKPGGIQALARKLGRSKEAVRLRARKLALGQYISGQGNIALCLVFSVIYGGARGNYTRMRKKWEAHGLNVHKLRVAKKQWYTVQMDEFWRWAEAHKGLMDFSQFPEAALGKEPGWVKAKRAIDRENHANVHAKRHFWTPDEEAMLRCLVQGGAGYAELERALNRTATAIRRKIYDLYLPQPQRTANRIWTDAEVREMLRLRAEGYTHKCIAQKLGRAETSVRAKYEYIRKKQDRG